MNIKEKDAIISRVARYGIDASGMNPRSLNVIKTLMDYLEERADNYVRLREDLKNYLNRYYTETAVSQATGLSRGNISRNATYKALIAAVRPPISNEVHISLSEYQKAMDELETLRIWSENETLRQLRHAEEKKTAQTIVNESQNDAAMLKQLTNEVLQLRKEVKQYKAIIEEQKLVIKVDAPFDGPEGL